MQLKYKTGETANFADKVNDSNSVKLRLKQKSTITLSELSQMQPSDFQGSSLISSEVAYPAPETLDEYRRVDTLNTTQAALRFLRLRNKAA